MFDLPDDEIVSLSKEHVFWTWSAQAKVNPIAVKRAKGVYFWDVNDKRYLDFNSMTMVSCFSYPFLCGLCIRNISFCLFDQSLHPDHGFLSYH